MSSTGASTARRRVLGLAFVLIIALFLVYTVLVYQKVFKDVTTVELVTSSVGNSLPDSADVKANGLIVGEVRNVTNENGEARIEMAIDDDKLDLIPSNTTGRLLPKTLFGERYVSLILPAADPGNPISAGSVLREDKSGNAVEVSRVLEGLLPLLQAIPPQDVASTLGALSQGLSGRGEKLGQTLDQLNSIASQVNVVLPDLQESLRSFAVAADTYKDAVPDLVNALDDLRSTTNTFVDRRSSIEALISSVASTSSATAGFLETNHDAIIGIAADSREALDILAKYSPTFQCMFKGFSDALPLIDKATGVGTPQPGLRLVVEFVNPKGRYLPNQDEPRLFDNRPPSCFKGLASSTENFPQYPGGSIGDGSYQIPSRNPGPETIPAEPPPVFPPTPAPLTSPISQGSAIPAVPSLGIAGSAAEQQTLQLIYGQATGTPPESIPGWASVIGAPALRGAEVSIK